MELLVILLGEFLLFPFIAAIGTLVNLAATLIGGVFELIFCLIPSTGKEKSEALKSNIVRPKKTFPLKAVTRISGALFLIIIVSLLAVNTFLFEPTARFIISKVEDKTNIEIAFSSVGGNVFSGELALVGLNAQRQGHEKLDFDISAQKVELNIDIFSLLSNPITLETFAVDGVRGNIRDKTKQKDVTSKSKFEAAVGKFKFGIKHKDNNQIEVDIPLNKLKAKKTFVVNNMAINDVEIDIYKNDKEPLVLALNKIHSAPFRSKYAVFDTFFRSNIEGSLNNHKITITSEEIGDGRNTKWHLDNFPVSLIKGYVHKAPFSWFESGSIDILVEDKWQYGNNAEIEMDWNMQLKGVAVKAPKDASVVSKAIALPIVNYIKKHDDDVDFRFSLVMNEKQFESKSSLDASGLWDTVINALSKKMAAVTGSKKEEINNDVENGIQGFKSFLNKKRNKE